MQGRVSRQVRASLACDDDDGRREPDLIATQFSSLLVP